MSCFGGLRLVFPKQPTGFFSLLYFNFQLFSFNYEIIVRSNTSSFGHSDPDSSSVVFCTSPLNAECNDAWFLQWGKIIFDETFNCKYVSAFSRDIFMKYLNDKCLKKKPLKTHVCTR